MEYNIVSVPASSKNRLRHQNLTFVLFCCRLSQTFAQMRAQSCRKHTHFSWCILSFSTAEAYAIQSIQQLVSKAPTDHVLSILTAIAVERWWQQLTRIKHEKYGKLPAHRMSSKWKRPRVYEKKKSTKKLTLTHTNKLSKTKYLHTFR